MTNLLNRFGNWMAGTTEYTSYTIGGFTYRVESIDPKEDEETAYRLHELNLLSVSVISYIRSFLDAAEDGALSGADRDIDIRTLKEIYDRLRYEYSPDALYESLSTHEGSSYVINQGEEMHMCVRGEPISVLITVLTHELGHIASTTPDHDNEFWDNYSVLQQIVSNMNIIPPEAIPPNGATHCGKIKVSAHEIRGIAGNTSDGNGDNGWNADNPLARFSGRVAAHGSPSHFQPSEFGVKGKKEVPSRNTNYQQTTRTINHRSRNIGKGISSNGIHRGEMLHGGVMMDQRYT